jgi:hypothetical protein
VVTAIQKLDKYLCGSGKRGTKRKKRCGRVRDRETKKHRDRETDRRDAVY